MSRLTDLLRRLEQRDPDLANEIRDEVAALSDRRANGLNFERHSPETVELPQRRIRRGDKVRFLAPRGEVNTEPDSRLWKVTRVTGSGDMRTADLIEHPPSNDTPVEITRVVANLVAVAEFRDPIYPGLRSTGTVERGGSDKPFHTVINGENYHALEALRFAFEGKVDCIYIDPPYNTGAKDWKYNNDYVDSEDEYRHSKWLAMMERRLKVARRLLNPANSVLIVTIDEKEYLRLGMLLGQTFPEARIQMVSSQINPAAVARAGYFGRSDEYYYFVMFGNGGPRPLPLSGEWVTTAGRTHKGEIRWDLLRKSGSSPTRSGHPETFYPIFVTNDGKRIHSVGEPIGVGADRTDTEVPVGTFAVWPIRQNGSEGRWRLKPETARRVLAEGGIRLGEIKGETTPVYYLAEGERSKVDSGIYEVLGRREDGSIVTSTLALAERNTVPGTQWRIGAHDATQYGTRLLLKMMPDRKFPFPKSLYAVEDALRFIVKDKPEAIILDFFAGSGTTAHAVMRLNRQDGGRRRAILVTNNEVSDEEAKTLTKQGFRDGDTEWEALGICEYITKPRVRAAITGLTPDGVPIKGDYKFADEFPMAEGFEENAEFFDLTYEDPERIRHDLAFTSIAPLLWMRAGSEGRRIDTTTSTFDLSETYGVLFNLDSAGAFISAVRAAVSIRLAYIVTDDEKQYQLIARELPERVGVRRLYESYLGLFEMTGEE